MILEGGRSSILLDAASKPESLKIIFSLLPKEDRFKAITHEVHDGKIIHQVALYPESLMTVLRSLSLEEQLNALKIETLHKKTVLEQIISNPSLFMEVFSLVPKKLQFQVINEKSTAGINCCI